MATKRKPAAVEPSESPEPTPLVVAPQPASWRLVGVLPEPDRARVVLAERLLKEERERLRLMEAGLRGLWAEIRQRHGLPQRFQFNHESGFILEPVEERP